jgi:phage terminase large subunit-like protein
MPAAATEDMSLEHRAALMSPEELAELLDGVDLEDLEWDWRWNGRPSQILPVMPDEGGEDWALALALAGRGFGKTLMGAQWIRETDAAWKTLGQDTAHLRVALLGRTSADVRDTMLEGPSGLLNVYPPSVRDQVVWTPSRRRVELPNGGVCLAFSSEEPSQLRGPAFHRGWCDELASYKQIRSPDDDATAWENLRIAVRLGEHPQILATTTPKRVPVLRQILAQAGRDPRKYLMRRGRTYDNKYLAEGYLDVLTSLYGGTGLGRQELEGEMLDDVAGAMTSEAVIERNRVSKLPPNIPWIKLVSIDPSVAERPHDECGIVVIYVSRTWPVLGRHAFVVDDLSLRASPTVWADVAVRAANDHDATIIAETNQGANLVFQMLRQAADHANLPMPPMKEVWSTKAKAVRMEPVGAAYDLNRIHHVGVFADLESQATTWTANDAYSPDRLDADVQGIASALFPEALTTGGGGGRGGPVSILSAARTHLPISRMAAQDRRVSSRGLW